MFVPMPIISRPINVTNNFEVYNDTVVNVNKKGKDISISEFKDIYKFNYVSKAEWICKDNPDVEIYDIVYSHKDEKLIIYSDKPLNVDNYNKHERDGRTTVFERNISTETLFVNYCEQAKNGKTVKEENEISLYDFSVFLLEKYNLYSNNMKYYENKVGQKCCETMHDDFSCTGIEIERNKMYSNRLDILIKLMFSSLGTYYHPRLKIAVTLTEDNKIDDAYMREAENFHLEKPKDAFIVVNSFLDKIVENYINYEKFMINYETVCVSKDVYVEIATNQYFHVKISNNSWSLRSNSVIEFTKEKDFNITSVSRKVLYAIQNQEKTIFKNTFINLSSFYKDNVDCMEAFEAYKREQGYKFEAPKQQYDSIWTKIKNFLFSI